MRVDHNRLSTWAQQNGAEYQLFNAATNFLVSSFLTRVENEVTFDGGDLHRLRKFNEYMILLD